MLAGKRLQSTATGRLIGKVQNRAASMTAALGRIGWRRIAQRNALASTNVAALRAALAGSGPLALVFGWHYYYAGGCSRTEIITRSADDLLTEIAASKPGDHFTLYSLAATAHLADHRMVLTAGAEQLLTAATEDAARLSREQEAVAVLAGPTPALETLYDLDQEEVSDLRSAWQNAGSGEIFLFRSDILDHDAQGQPITSVSLPTGRRRIHALLDAKRPTLTGRTPAHGPY